MRPLAALLLLTAVAATTSAAEPDARETVKRGLKYLTAEATAWKADRKCASCHHTPLGLWAMNEAKARGYEVDAKSADALTDWVLAKDDPAKVNPKQPEKAEVTVNQSPLMQALGIAAGGKRDGMKVLFDPVLAGQDKDGAWRVMQPWEPLAPAADITTSLALLALTDPNAPDLGEAGKAAREKGAKWLDGAKASDTTQADALRLILWVRLDRPAKERIAVAERLGGRQNADGGWGFEKGSASDAFASGQAVYALVSAGAKADDPAVRKGVAYLVKAQREDGSWAMASRPGGGNGKPAKDTGPISLAGSAWAVIGLARSTPAAAAPEK